MRVWPLMLWTGMRPRFRESPLLGRLSPQHEDVFHFFTGVTAYCVSVT